jgi:hypothetical protein
MCRILAPLAAQAQPRLGQDRRKGDCRWGRGAWKRSAMG